MQLLKQPQALFGLPAPNRDALLAMDRYLGQLAATLEAGSWDREVLEMLELMPRLFLKIGDHVEIPVVCVKVLMQHMYVVYLSFLKDRNPQMDEMLLTSSRYSYHLLHLFRDEPEYKPYHPVDAYKRALLLDPDWALRWCIEEKDSVFYPEVIQHVAKTKDFNARSAITFHRLRAIELGRKEALADIHQRLALLMRDPYVCLWLADFYPELERKVLFRSALGNPPYLLIWADKSREFDGQIRRDLLRFPAWLADYIHVFNPPDARSLWLQARERCTNEWLMPWVEQFGKAAGWL